MIQKTSKNMQILDFDHVCSKDGTFNTKHGRSDDMKWHDTKNWPFGQMGKLTPNKAS